MRIGKRWMIVVGQAVAISFLAGLSLFELSQLAYAISPTGRFIDTFDNSAQTVSITDPAPKTVSNTVLTGEAIGGERDLLVTKTVGNVNRRILLDVDSLNGQLFVSVDPTVQGEAVVTWDGSDGDPANLDTNGLGGVNLATNPIYPFDGFHLLFIESDLAVTMTLEVYSGANWSSAVITTPGSLFANQTPRSVFVPFSDFVVQGGSGANFNSVGAIQIVYDITNAYDGIIDFVETVSRDFGDLPAVYNNTIMTDDGARHVINGLLLGTTVDGEGDGQEDASAGGTGGGDDSVATSDDEEGVVRSGIWKDGVAAASNGGAVDVTVTGGKGCISGWIDWNDDGDFQDTFTSQVFLTAPEEIFTLQPVDSATNPNNITFNVPDNTFTGSGPNLSFFARFRLVPDSDNDGVCTDETITLAVTGEVYGGEVEDYQWSFTPTAITLRSFGVDRVLDLPAILPIALVGVSLVGTGLFIWRDLKRRTL